MSCINCERRPRCNEPCGQLSTALAETQTPRGDALILGRPESTEKIAKREFTLKDYHDNAIDTENQFSAASVINAEGQPPCKAKQHSRYRIG